MPMQSGGISGGGNPFKQMIGGTPSNGATPVSPTQGWSYVRLDAANESYDWPIRSTYSSRLMMYKTGMTIELLWFALGANGATTFRFFATWKSEGETIPVTWDVDINPWNPGSIGALNTIVRLDITPLFGGIADGDYFGCVIRKLESDGNNVGIIGILISE